MTKEQVLFNNIPLPNVTTVHVEPNACTNSIYVYIIQLLPKEHDTNTFINTHYLNNPGGYNILELRKGKDVPFDTQFGNVIINPPQYVYDAEEPPRCIYSFECQEVISGYDYHGVTIEPEKETKEDLQLTDIYIIREDYDMQYLICEIYIPAFQKTIKCLEPIHNKYNIKQLETKQDKNERLDMKGKFIWDTQQELIEKSLKYVTALLSYDYTGEYNEIRIYLEKRKETIHKQNREENKCQD